VNERQVEVARALEKRGQTEAAMEAYRAAGAFDDAARLLAVAKRFAEAAALLADGLGVPPEQAGELDAPGRKRALSAALYYQRAGDTQRAVPLFLGLGERVRAAEALAKAGDLVGAAKLSGTSAKAAKAAAVSAAGVPVAAAQTASSVVQTARNLEAAGRHQLALEAYVQARDWASAGRMAIALGRPRDAADLFANAGLAWEAAASWHRAGDIAKSLESLVRVPRDHARYRNACVRAIRMAGQLGALDFHLEVFLQQFLSDAPQDEAEADAVYSLGRLYQQHDFPENARDAYRRLLAVRPHYLDAEQRLAALDAEARGAPQVYEKIVKENEAFRGQAPAPGPETPVLPPLPPTPAPAEGAVRVTIHPRPAPAPLGGLPSFGPPPRPAPASAPAAAVPLAAAPAPAPSPPPAPAPAAASSAPVAASAPAPSPASVMAPPRSSGPPEVGTVFAERYRIEAKIGQGGMASVFRATDLELSERVAIKVFSRPIDDPQLLARFKQELTLSRKLNHPNILRLYDIGAVEGCRYITMELLSGNDLKAKLGRPLDLATGLDYMLQACSALGHAHERGVVHRDIKPANLFLTEDNVIKLMDFGIAKRQETPGLTVAGMIAGTPEYMSPEQISGFESVTASTDLYALGIMLYQFFTGNVPFRHAEVVPLLMMHVKDRPRPPREVNAAIPAELEALTLKLLEKDPKARFSDCRSLAKALQDVRAKYIR